MSSIFIKELKELLGKQYIVKKNTRYEDYETKANILIFAEFNCNIPDKKNGWVSCGKCDCHYGCHTSQRFQDLIEKNNYEMDWENCCIAGLYKKKQ